jgi:hypothetical protein
MEASDRLEHYDLDAGRGYRYLRTQPVDNSDENSLGVREDPKGNVEKFQELEQQLLDLGFQDDQMETLCSLIAAILNLGEVRFKQEHEEEAELENPEVAMKGEELFFKDVHCNHSRSDYHHCCKFKNKLPIANNAHRDLQSNNIEFSITAAIRS